MKRSASGLIVAFVLAALTAISYLGWLGWDQEKVVDATGHASGPYESWQVLGLAVTLGLLAGAAGWIGRPLVASVIVPVVLTACFAVDAIGDPESDGLWVVGAALVAVGSATAIAIVAQVAHVVRGQLEPRQPRGGAQAAGPAPAP